VRTPGVVLMLVFLVTTPPSSSGLNGQVPPAGHAETTPAPSASERADTDAGSERLGPIGPIQQPRVLRDWTLVLRSMQIPFGLREQPTGWFILVAEDEHARAVEAIRLYEAENRNWPPRALRERLPHARTLAAPIVMLALVLFFGVTGPSSGNSSWFQRGTASSELIWHGQVWRAVTGLTLHADVLHVVGNALSGSIFLSAVNRRLGDGRGPLLALVAGTLGNLMNAAWYRVDHLSIGASTMVFATVGLLSATQLAIERHETSDQPKPRWSTRVAPIVGGLALLGMLGASPHSDLLAHLFGFIAGVLVGVLAAWAGVRRWGNGPVAQAAFGTLGAAIVFGSWFLALH
jgi:rhomboid protease GluP